MKRVGVMGFIHESNTFSVTPTTYEHFEQVSLTRGRGLIERWTGGNHELSGFLEGAQSNGLEPVPLVAAFAMPSGAIVRETFDAIADEAVEALKAALPVDGLYLALHGATVSEEFPDADGEMARRMREVVGPDVPVVMTLDLHANVSPGMAASTDATTIYRSNPHLDQKARGLEAASLLGPDAAGRDSTGASPRMPPL